MQPDSLQNTGSESSLHEEVWVTLPEYVTELLHGQEISRLYPEVAQHIKQCAVCQERVKELHPLAQALYAGEVKAMPPDHIFNLAFLSMDEAKIKRKPTLWSWKTAETAVLLFSKDLLDKLSIPGAQEPQLQWATTPTRSTRGLLRYLYETWLEQPEGNKPIQLIIKVYEGRELPKMAQLEIMVDRSSQDPLSQEGTTVSLSSNNFERKTTTTAAGFALFEDVPMALLPSLRVEIRIPLA